MKTIILPLSILLFATACTREKMPAPANADNTSAASVRISPAYAERLSGDTLIKITRRPDEKGPVPNEKEPAIKKQ